MINIINVYPLDKNINKREEREKKNIVLMICIPKVIVSLINWVSHLVRLSRGDTDMWTVFVFFFWSFSAFFVNYPVCSVRLRDRNDRVGIF